MSKKPIVVYGANGYTGRLVCESLREYQLPFVAVGRSAERLEAAMAKVPGIETADYDIAEVDHDVEALSRVFKGAKVVCNTVGPFHYLGETTVQAALAAGCHYLDTTGEQAFMMRMRENYAAAFAEQDLALTPAAAYMHSIGEISAQIVLEEEGIDTLEVACIAAGIPTYGSTQTIFAMFQAEHYFLENKQLAAWEKGRGWEVPVPGMTMTMLAHPWGGSPIPLIFQTDRQVRNCRHLTAFTNRPMFEQLIALQQHYEANLKELPDTQRQAELQKIAENMQPGMPPRENKLVHRTIDFTHGRGSGKQRTCIIRSTAPYQATGIVQAAVANSLLAQGTLKAGFASAGEIVGHRYLLGELQNFLPVSVEINATQA